MNTISELQTRAWEQAEAKGFHQDRPADPTMLTLWRGQKIALMHSELSEALEELRNGRAVNETYYPTLQGFMHQHDGDYPQIGEIKPEGVPSELADTVIRILDFCGTEGIDLAAIIDEKLAYNQTREHLHGRKF